MSEFGNKIRVKISGTSHGHEVRAEITGFPADEKIDTDELLSFLSRRAPGRNVLVSSRREDDIPVFLSGIKNGITDGGRIAAVIKNKDVRSADYDSFRDVPRPGHADYTARIKYGADKDMSGAGEFSGRLTAPLCVAGGLALQVLRRKGIFVGAHLSSVGDIDDDSFPLEPGKALFDEIASKQIPVISDNAADKIKDCISSASESGDSVGGSVECCVTGIPAGIGGAMTDGVESFISSALFGIPGVKGVEFGSGFSSCRKNGSGNNDAFYYEGETVKTSTNNCGGILGGITDGMPLVFRVAFKPTPSISIPQRSVDLSRKENTVISVSGRHDPCIALRAVPVVEAVAALCVLDLIIENEEKNDIPSLRSEIDRLDERIVSLLLTRLEISSHIGEYKRDKNIPVSDSRREEEILAKLSEISGEKSEDIRCIYREIFNQSKQIQEKK